MFFLFLEKSRDKQQCGGDADAGIGDVEGGPPTVAIGHDFLEAGQPDADKIDHISFRKSRPKAFCCRTFELKTLQQAVGEIAYNTGEQQAHGDPRWFVREQTFFPEMADGEQREHRHEEKHDGCPCGAIAHAKSDSLIVNADDVKPRTEFDDAKAIAGLGECKHDPPFADLIEHVDRQGKPAEELSEAQVHG